ncbi:glycosyltransferase family 1 protein [Aureimonas leprariae]|uniref:F5/8 type C domain-containing protein n=1 Tax=Plantimonas leprariae TaxID=2615207 RepID=A0A7V7PK34_9HYPH|nr:glycosyltransferase family 1 protein [Aureimonas leprariae]KAB0675917.1 hypothetical protein F6X38_22565 [Aureimonas leprariae]
MTSKPVFGSRPFGKRDARLLIVAYFDPNGIETIPQSIEAWQRHSRHEIVLFNLWPGRAGQVLLPSTLALREFDGVIVHPTVSYHPSIVEGLDALLPRGLAEFDGVKILMKQDEQVLSGRLPGLVRAKGFDLVMTCVPPREQEKIYPRALIGDARLFQTLTGYVAPAMRQGFRRQDKRFALTYRGSLQPLAFGRLGYEKRGIGYQMSALLAKHADIRCDISSRWEDRISGKAWSEFLAASNVVLGVESGSNIFDFDGEVGIRCSAYEARHGNEDPWSQRYYDRAHEEFLHSFEGNVDYAQISPRHFEAAAMGAAQLLYEGRYSGIFRPGEHYFPLARDLVDPSAIIDFLRDEAAQGRMADRAFEEIVLAPRYWYETFVSQADDAIDECLATKGRRARPPGPAPKPVAHLLSAKDPIGDPEIERFVSSLSATHDVVVIGIRESDDATTAPVLQRRRDGTNVLRLGRTDHRADWIPSAAQLAQKPSEARSLLAVLVGCLGAPADVLAARLGADIAVESELEAFRDRCRHLIDVNSTFIAAIGNLGAPDVTVAFGLEALFAAIACADDFGCEAAYDVSEFRRFTHGDFQHWEIEFWQTIEKRLAARCARRFADTPLLADLMTKDQGHSFLASSHTTDIGTRRVRGTCEPDLRWIDRPPPERIFPCSAPAVASSVFGNPPGRRLVDIALASRGASIVGSSPFHERPNDADAVLRAEPGGYAAALADGAPPCWVEIDLGRVEAIEAVEIGFLAASVPEEFSVLCRDGVNRPWRILVERSHNSAQRVRERFPAGAARFLRLIAFSFAGVQNRLLLSSFRVFASATAATAATGDRAGQPTSAEQRQRLGVHLMHDVSTGGSGSRVVASSPFNPDPNGAAAALRRDADGYAAALNESPFPHWLEIDLGRERTIGAIGLRFLNAANFASGFRVSGRREPSEPWHVLIERRDHSGADVLERIDPVAVRFLQLEAFAFAGQQRLLLAALHAYEMPQD